MVGVSISCRMGNQLFQYAFIKALSKRYNTTFFINDNIEKFTASKYFDLKGYNPILNFLKQAFFKLTIAKSFRSLNSTPVEVYSESEFNSLIDNKVYRGYFQSELFFKNIKQEISLDISVKKAFQNEFYSKYGTIFSNNKIIAIHVRRGDYLELNSWWIENLGSSDLTLPMDYYLHTLKQIPDYKDYKLIFVSDDVEFVKKQFEKIDNAIFSKNSLIVDFQIIMNADICIISHSSFSWWAAYLNKKENKKVLCPEHWLGFKIKKEYPNNIIPKTWKKIPVY